MTSLGAYRLSTDEQRENASSTLQATRVHRLLEVRRQSRHFAAEQLNAFKSARNKEDSNARRLRTKRREEEREDKAVALLRQFFKEQEQLGEAQRNAQKQAESETRAFAFHQHEEKVRLVQKRQRFSKALDALRKADAAKRRLLSRCIENRRLEKEKSRTGAVKYRQTTLATARPPVETRSRKVQLDAAQEARSTGDHIDFCRTRLHQQLGIATRAQKHDSDKENAAVAAQKESVRSSPVDGLVYEGAPGVV